MRDSTEDLILLTPAALLLTGVFILPAANILSLAFQGEGGHLTLEHFARILTDGYYLGVVWRTIKLSAAITALCAVLGFPFAYVAARASPRIRVWLVVAVTLPLMTSVVVRTFGWMVLLGRGGLVPQALHSLGFVRRGFSLMHTEAAVVIGMAQVLFPFMVLSVLGVILKIDRRLEEAARTMGCGFLGTLAWVILPLAAPGLVAGSLLVFSLSASYFITPSLLGGSRLPVLAGSVYEAATKTLEWPFAAAQSIVLLAGVVAVLIPYFRLSGGRRG